MVVCGVSIKNKQDLRQALLSLPDRAVADMADGDLDRYVVVRIADEFVVDLMKAAGGVGYAEASRMVDIVVIEDVPIPFASPRLLWRTKQTFRDKDRLDCGFLRSLRADQDEGGG